MKKIFMILFAVLVVVGFSSYVFADPGWSKGHRYDSRYKHEKTYNKYNHRDYRDFHRDHLEPYYQPVAVHRAHIAPPEPVISIVGLHVPVFSIFFPHMSIVIR